LRSGSVVPFSLALRMFASKLMIAGLSHDANTSRTNPKSPGLTSSSSMIGRSTSSSPPIPSMLQILSSSPSSSTS
jgi:hypothetical protein